MSSILNHKQPKLLSNYDSVIVSYSNGIDSMGALHWAVSNFDKNKIYLIYADTGMEYDCNISLFYAAASFVGVKPILVAHPKGFLRLLLEERLKFPDYKRRWCTAYLKANVIDKWIRQNRHILGQKCLFISGERGDESPKRALLPENKYHRTHLATNRVAEFECHWYRPNLPLEKGHMFEKAKILGLPTHPCYQYLNRCSCMFCFYMKDEDVIKNIIRYPKEAKKWIQAEIKLGHTWKAKQSLTALWQKCDELGEDAVA